MHNFFQNSLNFNILSGYQAAYQRNKSAKNLLMQIDEELKKRE